MQEGQLQTLELVLYEQWPVGIEREVAVAHAGP
jgi:hypothetical protein